MKFLVRFEVDCADYEKSVPVANEDDSVSDLMSNLTLSELKGQRIAGSDLYYIKKFHLYNYRFVELTTRIFKRSFPSHVWPQMFFSGIEVLIIGWQNFGKVLPNRWNRCGAVPKKKGIEIFPVAV